MTTQKFPNQPTFIDRNGTIRFVKNPIVDFLLERGPFDLNDLAKERFDDDASAQFAQLIGYSVCGWGDLSYVSEAKYLSVENDAAGMSSEAAFEAGYAAGIARVKELIEMQESGEFD
jgi:hypothetical protein